MRFKSQKCVKKTKNVSAAWLRPRSRFPVPLAKLEKTEYVENEGRWGKKNWRQEERATVQGKTMSNLLRSKFCFGFYGFAHSGIWCKWVTQ